MRRIPENQSTNTGDLGKMIVNVKKLGLGADCARRDDQIGGGYGASAAPQIESKGRSEVEVLFFQREPVEGAEAREQCSLLSFISREPNDLDEDDTVECKNVVGDGGGHGLLDRR